MLIGKEKIEEVRQAADMVEVISDYVRLRKSGSYWVGLSPFKTEKTPSFTVSPHLGIFKCFSTGIGGDLFNFLMEVDGVSFEEAVRNLAERFNVDLPQADEEELSEHAQEREAAYHALRFAGTTFYKWLVEEEEAELARAYLKKRGLTRETIKKYGLGYAKESYSALLNRARSAGLKEQALFDSGLLRRRDNEDFYDYFRGRLMFPIFSPSQKVIGFGGRILKDEKTAKYINSPQTSVYNKSEVLYGIHVAKNEIRKVDKAIIVEGYMDVLSLHQAGIKHVVSSSGTALTVDQARILKRYSDRLIMIYDADVAGQNAMIKALPTTLGEGLQVELLHLPDGEDPDSFVQKFGKESFLAFLAKESLDFIRFLQRKAEDSGDWDDANGRKRAVNQIVEFIGFVPDSILRESMIQELSGLAKIGDRALLGQLAEVRQKQKRQRERNREIDRRELRRQDDRGNRGEEPLRPQEETQHQGYYSRTTFPPYEKELIRLMVQHERSMVEYVGQLCNADHFSSDELRMFFEDLIRRFQADEEISVSAYSQAKGPFPFLISEVMMEKNSVSERSPRAKSPSEDSQNPYRQARGALKALKIHFLERKAQGIEQQLTLSTDFKSEEYRSLRQFEIKIRQNRLQFLNKSDSDLFPESDWEREKQEKDQQD